MSHKIEPVPIQQATIESTTGNGHKKKIFSVSGATDKTHSFIYFGIHGSTEKLELSDTDLDTLDKLIKELKDARSKSSSGRIDYDRQRYRRDSD